MQKIVSLLLAAAVFSAFLSGCSPETAGSGSSASLSDERPGAAAGESGAPQKNAKATASRPEESSAAPNTQRVPEVGAPDPSSSVLPSGSSSEPEPRTEQSREANSQTEPQTEPEAVAGEQPISPWTYQKLLGKGMDVDWSKTNQGRKYYNAQAAEDFAAAGVSHVRIRIADWASSDLLEGLDRQIADCLEHGLLPVIAYQADDFKNDPDEKNVQKVVDWWSKVARRYQDASYLLSFDLLLEATDALNKQPEALNELYEMLVTEIRKTNPERIIMISPRLRSDAAYLHELEIPSSHNGYLMAEWHFYASGPSKTNDRKLWTTGSDHERSLIDEKIALALAWQKETGIPTWVGAWMPGNYNDGNDYTIEEQVAFASYMTRQLTAAGIPFAVNSDTKFYDRKANEWIPEMEPVFDCIYH